MSEKTVIETIYGKYHKFEIVKDVGMLGGISLWIHRDGRPFKGSYSSLSGPRLAKETQSCLITFSHSTKGSVAELLSQR